MSRIGKKPVVTPSGVTASIEGQTLTVKGPKGTLSMKLLDDLVKYEVGEGEIRVTPLGIATGFLPMRLIRTPPPALRRRRSARVLRHPRARRGASRRW